MCEKKVFVGFGGCLMWCRHACALPHVAAVHSIAQNAMQVPARSQGLHSHKSPPEPPIYIMNHAHTLQIWSSGKPYTFINRSYVFIIHMLRYLACTYPHCSFYITPFYNFKHLLPTSPISTAEGACVPTFWQKPEGQRVEIHTRSPFVRTGTYAAYFAALCTAVTYDRAKARRRCGFHPLPRTLFQNLTSMRGRLLPGRHGRGIQYRIFQSSADDVR